MDSRLGAPAAVSILSRESASIITAGFLAQYYQEFVKRNEMTSMLDLYGDNAHITLADVSEETPIVAQGRRAVLLHLAKIDSLLAQRKVEIINADSVPLPAGGVHIICQGIMFLRNFRRVFLQTFVLMPTLYREKTFHIVSDYLRFVNSEEEVIPAGVPILTPDQVAAHLAEEARRREFELEQKRLMELKQQLWEEQRAEEAAARAREQREQQEKREREERQRREREEQQQQQQQQWMKQHQSHTQQQQQQQQQPSSGPHGRQANYGQTTNRPPAAPRSTQQQQQQQQHSSHSNESERGMDQQKDSVDDRGMQRGYNTATSAAAANYTGATSVRVGHADTNLATMGAAPAYNNNNTNNNNNNNSSNLNINYRASGYNAGPNAGRMPHTHATEQRRCRGAESGPMRNANRPARMSAEYDHTGAQPQEEERKEACVTTTTTTAATAGRSERSERPPAYIGSRRVGQDDNNNNNNHDSSPSDAKLPSSSSAANDASRAGRVGEEPAGRAAAAVMPSPGRARREAEEGRKPNATAQSGAAETGRAGREERGANRDRRGNNNSNNTASENTCVPAIVTYAQKVAGNALPTAASHSHGNTAGNRGAMDQRGNNNNSNRRGNLAETNDNDINNNNNNTHGSGRDAARSSRQTGGMSNAPASESKSSMAITTRLDRSREGGRRGDGAATLATGAAAPADHNSTQRRSQRGEAATSGYTKTIENGSGSATRRERRPERKPREENDTERTSGNQASTGSTGADARGEHHDGGAGERNSNNSNNKVNANAMDSKSQASYEENKENTKRGRDRASAGAQRKNGLTSAAGSDKEKSAERTSAANGSSSAAATERNTNASSHTECATDTAFVRLLNVPREIKLSDIKRTLVDTNVGEACDVYWFGRDRSHAVIELPTKAIAQKMCDMQHIKISNTEVKVVTFYR